MKTKLFDLINSADKIVICGYEVENVCFGISYGEANNLVRLLAADDVDYDFANQDVELVNGGVLALDQSEDTEEEPTAYRIEFKVERQLTPEDVITADPERSDEG